MNDIDLIEVTGTLEPAWYTAEETAEILRVHVTTVHDLCRRGELVAMKAGRDWRISVACLHEKSAWGDAHAKLTREIAERTARLVVMRVVTMLAEALNRELSRAQMDRAQPT